MVARAEGLQSLFLQKPEYNELARKYLKNEDVACVLYEIAVSFGEITVEKVGKSIVFWRKILLMVNEGNCKQGTQ